MTSWAQLKMVGLDFETTGVNTEEDRAVTGSVVVIEPGSHPLIHSFLINPGIEIPTAASDIHGVTTEQAVAEGMPPAEAFGQIGELLAEHWTSDVPLVAYNASYDLSLYRAEAQRHGVAPLDMTDRHVVDPLVIDRHVDRYRKGGRKLVDACRHYRVELLDAHTSDADTLATLRLAYKIASRYPREVGLVSLPALHEAQRVWNRTWALRMTTFLRKEATRMESSWPLAKDGRAAAKKFIAEKLARLEITEEPTDELIAATIAQTRARADEFAAGADSWPIRPAVVLA